MCGFQESSHTISGRFSGRYLHYVRKSADRDGSILELERTGMEEPTEKGVTIGPIAQSDSVEHNGDVRLEVQEQDLKASIKRQPHFQGSDAAVSDVEAVIRGLERLAHDNRSTRKAVERVDEKVSRTELELNSLVSRSTNNNKHLQNLLLSAQDVRRLQELIEQLSKQQDAQIAAAQEASANINDADANSGAEDRIRQLTEELQAFHDQHESLLRLTHQVAEKERQLAVLDHNYECVRQRLRERTQELSNLKREYEIVDSRINDTLMERYKAVHANLAFSATALHNHTRPPVTKMNRITSMLRNKHAGGRRVMSLNVVDKYDVSPDNNSDEN